MLPKKYFTIVHVESFQSLRDFSHSVAWMPVEPVHLCNQIKMKFPLIWNKHYGNRMVQSCCGECNAVIRSGYDSEYGTAINIVVIR